MALVQAWQTYDTCVSRLVFAALDAVGLHKAGAAPSPLTQHLPLVASPTLQVTAVAAYLAIVLLGLARLRALGPGEPPCRLRHSTHPRARRPCSSFAGGVRGKAAIEHAWCELHATCMQTLGVRSSVACYC